MRRMLMVMGLAVASAAVAVPLEYPEGDLRAFPVLNDLEGNLLGRGRFVQRVEGDDLHVKVTYDQPDGGRIEETAVMTTAGDELGQRSWSWQLAKGGEVVERYTLNLDTGAAYSLVVKEDGQRDERRAKLEAVPGKTFSGLGFIYVVRNLHPRLVRGEKVELEAIAFLPKARKAKVTISLEGTEKVRAGGRTLLTDHLVIHPHVPSVARAFVNAPDSHIWLQQRTRPPEFVRAELQMQSLGMIRIDNAPREGPPAAARRRPTR